MTMVRRTRQRAGVALTLVGSLAVAIGAWLPWVVFSGGPSGGSYFDPGRADSLPLLFVFGDTSAIQSAWSLLTILGLALTPLLTGRAPAWLPRLGLALLWVWLLVMAVVVASIHLAIWQGAYTPTGSACAAACTALVNIAYAVGTFVTFGGLLLSAVGWGFVAPILWHSQSRAQRAGMPSAEGSVQNKLFGAGLVLWTVGFYLMPWATTDCGPATIIARDCIGVTSRVAMQASLTGAVVDPLVATKALPYLLGCGALGLCYAYMRGGLRTQAARRWVTAWLVAAAGGVALAQAGVGAIARHPSSMALPFGAWHGAGGIVVCVGGLLLLVACLVVAEYSARREPRQHASMRAQRSTDAALQHPPATGRLGAEGDA